MTIRVFSTGRVRQKRDQRGIRRYFANEWSEQTLPVNVFLIDHPSGLCLVDTGQAAAAADRRYFPRWYPFFRLARFEITPAQTVGAQLAAAGVSLSEVRWVVLTHMHTDHVGGIEAFPHAEIVVSRGEWEPAQGIEGRLRGYLPQYWPSGMVPRAIDFSGPAHGPFRASYDVAGDGRLLMVPLPGHTRGHAALLVRLDGARAVLCAGDAAHTAVEFAQYEPAVAEWCEQQGIDILTAHDDSAAARIASASSIAPR